MSAIRLDVERDPNEDILAVLVGKSITGADLETRTLTLSDGSRLVFDAHNWECCSRVDLTALTTTNNVITSAGFDMEYEPCDEEDRSPYQARLSVLTDAGQFTVAEAEGDASSGYYLWGFALGATYHPAPSGTEVSADLAEWFDVQLRRYTARLAHHEAERIRRIRAEFERDTKTAPQAEGPAEHPEKGTAR